MAAGITLPAAGSCLQAFPCHLALCLGLPALLHQCQTCVSPFLRRSRARLALGGRPLPLLPVCGGSCWGRSLSTRETKTAYQLLIRTSPPGPAESGWKNVAAGQAAPHGISGDAAVSRRGAPWVRGSPTPASPSVGFGAGCRGKRPGGRQVWDEG